MVYISFNIKSIFSGFETREQMEEIYQSSYRPLIKILNSNPDLCFSISLSGIFIEFLKKRHKEFVTLAHKLIERHQLEILGGGYYDPVLPLIPSVDRNAQIELLNSEIRQNFGKRPRGVSLFADCWDSSLINSLQLCGIEYVMLESSLIPDEKKKFLPLIMSELGKSIDVITYYDSLKPDEDENADLYKARILKAVEKASRNNNFTQINPDRLVCVSFSSKSIHKYLENNFFVDLAKLLQNQENPDLKFTLIQEFRKNNKVKLPVFISSGINKAAVRSINNLKTDDCKKSNYTVYDYLEAYPLCKNLYNRILYIGLLVNQYKADKMRKNEARQKLWQAQNGVGLLAGIGGADLNSQYRQKAYKVLMEAEKILRQDANFKESVNCFDYNCDGLDEYVCRMQNYFSYITLVSGAIQELDILKNTGNYSDNLPRLEQFDGCTDNYERGIFVDHILSKEQFDLYKNGKAAGDGVFSKIQYEQIKFNPKNHEIILCATAIYTPTKQKIYLRKKYIVNSNGMNVQYVVRNESNKPLNIVFAVESNFAHTNFNRDNITYFNLDVIENENLRNIDTSKALSEPFANVDVIRLTDSESGISFAFEPNETCDYFYEPLFINRPDRNEVMKFAHLTFVSTIFWNLELKPGMETEKNINFSITSVKKVRNISSE